MTSLIFASVSHVAHVEPCDDAEEGVGGHGSFALTMESAMHEDGRIPTITNSRSDDRQCAAVARARTEPHGHMLS
jgi:hypothetical protein